jgi:hypothetical protein
MLKMNSHQSHYIMMMTPKNLMKDLIIEKEISELTESILHKIFIEEAHMYKLQKLVDFLF